MCAMIRLETGPLRAMELNCESVDERAFLLVLGDSDYSMTITTAGRVPSHTDPGEQPWRPTLDECAEVIGELFRRMLLGTSNIERSTSNIEEERLLWRDLDVSEREEGPMEVDVEAGWAVYRAEILETMGPTCLPRWKDAPEQLRECFAAGVYAALRGARVAVEDSFRWSIEGAMEVVNP